MQNNLKLVNEVKKIAERRNLTPAQIALAWLRTLSGKPGLPTIIPIPGGTTSDKVIQNTKDIPELDDADMKELDSILKQHNIIGERYPQH